MRFALASTAGVWTLSVVADEDDAYVAYDGAGPALLTPRDATATFCAAAKRAGYQPCWMQADAWPAGVRAERADVVLARLRGVAPR